MNQDINDSIVYNIKALMITKTSDIEEIEQTHLLGLFLYKKQKLSRIEKISESKSALISLGI